VFDATFTVFTTRER